VFVPFLLIYPQADIPVVQLSLRQDLDPAAHLAIGRALAPLREEGVLIVGSGMSFHNLRYFGSTDPRVIDAAQRFDAWLTTAVEAPDEEERSRALESWSASPDALFCHPRAEHLAPLFVVAGAAGADLGRRVYSDRIIGKAVSGFQFG
jgi:aromatic ring-opening dioxygenase catalytic subunit (LigB family)